MLPYSLKVNFADSGMLDFAKPTLRLAITNARYRLWKPLVISGRASMRRWPRSMLSCRRISTTWRSLSATCKVNPAHRRTLGKILDPAFVPTDIRFIRKSQPSLLLSFSAETNLIGSLSPLSSHAGDRLVFAAWTLSCPLHIFIV
jgi:hypothetical protein